MKIWLIRHPKPVIAQGICYGQQDIIADANALFACAEALSDVLPHHLPVLTSPLIRAQSLAHALIHLRPDLQLHADDRLKEMNFGCWEQTPWSDIPKKSIDAWVEDFPDHRFGGEESAQDVVNRVDSLLMEKSTIPEMVWITHAGVIKATGFLHASPTGRLLSAKDWPSRTIGYGTYEVVDFHIKHRP